MDLRWHPVVGLVACACVGSGTEEAAMLLGVAWRLTAWDNSQPTLAFRPISQLERRHDKTVMHRLICCTKDVILQGVEKPATPVQPAPGGTFLHGDHRGVVIHPVALAAEAGEVWHEPRVLDGARPACRSGPRATLLRRAGALASCWGSGAESC